MEVIKAPYLCLEKVLDIDQLVCLGRPMARCLALQSGMGNSNTVGCADSANQCLAVAQFDHSGTRVPRCHPSRLTQQTMLWRWQVNGTQGKAGNLQRRRFRRHVLHVCTPSKHSVIMVPPI